MQYARKQVRRILLTLATLLCIGLVTACDSTTAPPVGPTIELRDGPIVEGGWARDVMEDAGVRPVGKQLEF